MVTFTITDSGGNKTTINNIPLSTLAQTSPDPWTTYKAKYVKVGSENEVVVSAYMLIDKNTYMTGYGYSFTDGTSILANGYL